MPNNIYPDKSNDKFDTRYGRLKALTSDLYVSKQGNLVKGEEAPGSLNPGDGGVVAEVPVTPSDPALPTATATRAPILIFLDRFRVQAGGVKEEGDTTYSNPILAGFDFVMYTHGIEISQVVNSEVRYVTKSNDTDLFLNGGFSDLEVIEIYLKYYPINDGIVDAFIVGAAGAPMVDGQTTYVNSLLSGHKFIAYSGIQAIHQLDDNAGERYCSKPTSGAGDDTITFNGGVSDKEFIQIYIVL